MITPNGKHDTITLPADHQDDARADHLIAEPDLDRAASLLSAFLGALGLDVDDEHLAGTPHRVAKMYAEMLTGGQPFKLTTFDAGEKHGESGPIIVRDIPVTSFCSHHLLPFTGVAHVGYIPRDRIVGLSKLARVVDKYAKRPQVQERLTDQVADHLMEHLDAEGVAVLISARHSCMELRGIRAVGAITMTSAYRGALVNVENRERMLKAVDATENRGWSV